MHTTAAALNFYANMWMQIQCATGMCSIKLKLFRSALGVGKIMCDPAPHVAHGRKTKTLQMCGSKIIPAFDLKGFMLVLGNIIRPCQQI